MNRAVLAFALCIAPLIGQGCCISYADAAMHLARETAVIVWDQEAKIEHFVRRAEFQGNAESFGFIFPCPSQPFRIEVASDELFGKLESYRPRPRSWGCSKSEDAGVTKAAAAGSVQVLEQKKVGDYEASVLRAADGKALAGWLKSNGHHTRPAMTPWFEHYSRQNWVFVAFKYLGTSAGRVPTKAVSISFKTDKPHYPYRMPSDTFAKNHYRPLDLYVLSQSRVQLRHDDGTAWPGKNAWSANLAEFQIRSVGKLLSGTATPVVLPKGLVLTRYQNSRTATNYASDLIVEPDRGVTAPILMSAVGIGLGILVARKRSKRA